MSFESYPYFGRRICATVIDYSVIFGISVFYIYSVGKEISPGYYQVTGFAALFPEAFWLAFIVLTERYMGGTLGHQLSGIKVVSDDRNELSLWQVFLRRIMDAIEIVCCFGVLAFIIARSNNGRRIGDLAAKTSVIGKNDSQEPFRFEFEE
jgi:uncharacterized RDD family membrane protein YckC